MSPCRQFSAMSGSTAKRNPPGCPGGFLHVRDNRGYGCGTGITTTPLFRESRQTLESAGPGLTNGPNGVSVSIELLNASSRLDAAVDGEAVRVGPGADAVHEQHAAIASSRFGNCVEQLPPPSADEAMLSAAAVH